MILSKIIDSEALADANDSESFQSCVLIGIQISQYNYNPLLLLIQ